MGRVKHFVEGDSLRFETIADFIFERFGRGVRYIADVGGGEGLLTRRLRKTFNYDCEVVDPRGGTLRGVPGRTEAFKAGMADYYDLIVALHPGEVLREVAAAALIRPVILIPAANYWSKEKMDYEALLAAIEAYYKENSVAFERVTLDFQAAKNIALVSTPPVSK